MPFRPRIPFRVRRSLAGGPRRDPRRKRVYLRPRLRGPEELPQPHPRGPDHWTERDTSCRRPVRG